MLSWYHNEPRRQDLKVSSIPIFLFSKARDLRSNFYVKIFCSGEIPFMNVKLVLFT